METVKSYTVIRNSSLKGLTDTINDMLKEDWEPLGGIAVTNESEMKQGLFSGYVKKRVLYVQAMINRKLKK